MSTNNNKSNNDSGSSNGDANDMSSFIHKMNTIVMNEDPADFLPELGGIDRMQSLTLMEMTHRGILNPSYSCYGFMLLKTLCKNDAQLRELYGNGTELIEESGVMNDEDLEEARRKAEEMVQLIILKLKEKSENNNNNNENDNLN